MAKILLGFMGAGKSTVARGLAQDFVDMDELLCQRLGLRDNLDVGNIPLDGGNVRRDKSAKIAVICIMALLAAVGLAVIAAGIVVGKLGTAVCTRKELEAALGAGR